jgi:hypothetical protein
MMTMSDEQLVGAGVNEVRIHIDEHRYESPNPTMGEALYKLGNVGPGLVLYREVTGDREDKVIPDGSEKVHLKVDEHFHSGPPERKEIHFFVDGEPYETDRPEWTPNEIIRKFGEKDPATHYLVRIEGHHRHSYEGKGDTPIEIHEGERFQIVSKGPTPVS